MLKRVKHLQRYAVEASDGEVGKVTDFLLDDERWTIRYLVVETGTFFSERPVLITPVSFRGVDWGLEKFELTITRGQVKHSPALDTDKPVSRQREMELFGYYGYPYYWAYSSVWGMGAHPGYLATEVTPPTLPAPEPGDVHLRSAKEVRGYDIEGDDGTVGHVEDFLVDDESWEIRYLVVETGHWWNGKKVLIAPRWASGVSWEDRRVYVDLSRALLKSSPEWDDDLGTVSRDYEARLHQHYARAGYWSTDQQAEPPRPHPGCSTAREHR